MRAWISLEYLFLLLFQGLLHISPLKIYFLCNYLLLLCYHVVKHNNFHYLPFKFF